MNKTIRLSKSCVGKEEIAAITRVINSEFLGMGTEVQCFEKEIQEYLNSDIQVICVNTGTSALHLALQCMGIGRGDEVLVPSITYVASFQAIAATGAVAIACDVTEDRVFIDLKDAELRITDRTRAIMPVHYASDSQDMQLVYSFAEKHKIRVVEDAAHAFGCFRNGQRVGSIGDVICFSFDGIKNITSGEGGAIVTRDLKLADLVRDARLLGVERDTEKRFNSDRSWDFDVKHQGYRYHMSNIMAAIGREQLLKLPKFAEIRCKLAHRYTEFLDKISFIKTLELSWDEIIPHIYVVRVLNGKRNELMEYLKSHGIQCGIHYKPNHQLSYFKGVATRSLPISDILGDELLSLPLHPDLNFSDQDKILELILNFKII